MHLIPLSSLAVRGRQRSSMDITALKDLRESILKIGLLHPPVAWLDEESRIWILSVGERRLRAIKDIAASNQTFMCDNQEVPVGQIPILTLTEFLSAADRHEAELVENTHREALAWQDETKALADLHRLRLAENPNRTVRETAQEIIAAGIKPSIKNETAMHHRVTDALMVAENLSNPKIANARNAHEARNLVLKQIEERALSELALRAAANPSTPTQIELRHADSLTVLPSLASDFVDLILADPPYGIDAGKGGFAARTVHHHDYDDSMEYSRNFQLFILTEGFRLAKRRANLLMFTDIKHFSWLLEAASNMGWTPFPRPLIWGKSDSEGLAPWGSQGPRITTEFIFFATKGQRGMISSPTDYWRVDRVARHERIHAAEKPVELLRKAIECTTLPGDMILDPCCGSGSSLIAAKELRRRAIGIEMDLDFFNTANANLFRTTEQVDAKSSK